MGWLSIRSQDVVQRKLSQTSSSPGIILCLLVIQLTISPKPTNAEVKESTGKCKCKFLR